MASEQQKEQARAAWESATVANLGPLLTDEQNDRIWEAIVAHREDGDAPAFLDVAREIAIDTDTKGRVALEHAAATLPAPDKE